MRKLIQISQCLNDQRDYSCLGLCDDGTLWEIKEGKWVLHSSIPQHELPTRGPSDD